MAWTILNKNYAANDDTGVIVTRKVQTNGYTERGYEIQDDPLSMASNRGRTYASFDERVADRERGGVRRIRIPVGMSYAQAKEAIRMYGGFTTR